jgi:hypothetical protein
MLVGHGHYIITRKGTAVFAPHRCSLLAASLILSGVMSGALWATGAHAAISSCRRDPIVTLSNGDQVQLTADIATSASNVKNISYVLYGPTGTTVQQVVFTEGTTNPTETFNYVADLPVQGYASDTVVTTAGGPPVHVTVTATVANGASASTIGQSKQDIITLIP